MDTSAIALIALFVAVLFSVMKMSVSAVNKLRLELDKKQGLFSSRIVSFFLSRQDEYSVFLFTGSVLSLIVFGYTSTLWLYAILPPVLPGFLILIIQIVVSSVLIVLFAEFVPKILVSINPHAIIGALCLPFLVLFILFYPVTFIIFKMSGGRNGFEKNGNSVGETGFYQILSRQNEKIPEGKASADEMLLIQNALEFTSVRVRDCMIPRPEIVALDIRSSMEELKKKFFETGFSKILIYENQFDNLVGYVTSKELFKNPVTIRPLLLEVPFVPETMPARILLHRLIQDHKSLAVVIDEFGGISGMITVEDIIEEIFGEIEDEHDNPELIEKKTGENEYILSGRLEIEALNEKYPVAIPESEEYNTIAGFIFYHFQNFPKINEIITIPPFEFKILKVSKTRIELVKLRILQ